MIKTNRLKIRSGKEIFSLLEPIYNSTSHQIRQHFVDPSVLMVLAGCHPATKVVIQNPSQELFHEIRTLNLLLLKKRIRMRISTKHLRKEINNLQRQASIIIESLNGFEKLSRSIFSKDSTIRHMKSFTELEDWKRRRVMLNKSTEKPLFDLIDEGEVKMEQLNLVSEKDKDKILCDFLRSTAKKDLEKEFKQEKLFNLLERINKTKHQTDMPFEELMNELRIVIKNSHLLKGGVVDHGLSNMTIEMLKDMLQSQYSFIQKIAKNVLSTSVATLQERVDIHNKFPVDDLEKHLHISALKKVQASLIKN